MREVAHEFGGQIPHGGGNRDSSGVGIGWFVIFVLLLFAIALLLCTFKYLLLHTRAYNIVGTSSLMFLESLVVLYLVRNLSNFDKLVIKFGNPREASM